MESSLEAVDVTAEIEGDDDLLRLIFESEGDLVDRGNLCFVPLKLKSWAS